MKASARHEGTKIYWNGCDFSKDRNDKYNNFVNHTCNIMEDIEEWNCKMFDSEAKTRNPPEVGHKQICKDFNDIIVSCEAGICKNVSSVYDCTFKVCTYITVRSEGFLYKVAPPELKNSPIMYFVLHNSAVLSKILKLP